jgi:predicted RNase H-like nuclease
MPLSGGMRKVLGETWFAGVDGCRAGWVVAFVRPQNGEVRLRVVPHFAEVIAAPEAPAIIAVDIPIGLPEHSGLRGRSPEREVRPLVGQRRSSVFRVPSRQAVYVGVDHSVPDDKERYIKACAVARATSVDKKAFGKQTFYLFPKIVEVDKVLRAQNKLINRVYETHPELAFWRLNGGRALGEPKRVKGSCHDPGLALRRSRLIEAGFPAAVVNNVPPKGASPDDLLDALACAAIAQRIHQGLAQRFPDPPEHDACGLPMAIWA